MDVASPSPPFFAIGGSGNIQSQQGYNNGDISQQQQQHSSSPSTSFSVIVVIIIIASAIIVSATIYLLIRFLSRRCHRNSTFSVADDVVSSNNNVNICFNHSSNQNDVLFDSLPLFTFGSLTGNVAGGDCAVCLSKFEPQDQLRLLPLCCHAFHVQCIDAWLLSNLTCPLCRSTVLPSESDVMNKILSASITDEREIGTNGNSFRIEIGSISRRRGLSVSDSGRRSYSIGSYEYVLDDGYEVSVGSTHRRGISDCTSVDKDYTTPAPEPPGESLAAEVSTGSGRNWLREYVDRVSSRTLSFRGGSGRFFSGSSRRSETVVVPVDDIEANNRIGEEISELFRWLSGV